jgi:Ca2+-binding RTX toxin-like protein
MIESLEARRLLAASVTIDAGGKLSVQGGSKGFNDIIVAEAGTANFVDLGLVANPGPGTVYYKLTYHDPVNGDIVFEGEKTGVTQVNINGRNEGSNISFAAVSLNSQIQGGSGVDYIVVNDSGTGSSKVTAGKGNDLVQVVQSNKTFVDAGDGADTIIINSAVDPDLDDDSAGFEALVVQLASELTTVKAGGGDDVIIVYDGKVTLDGGGGIDELIKNVVDGGTVTVQATNVETTTTV